MPDFPPEVLICLIVPMGAALWLLLAGSDVRAHNRWRDSYRRRKK